MRAAMLLVALCLGLSAQAAPKKVTFLFTGDNGGEVAPCG